MRLREVLDKYEGWGYNDFDIIKKYFQENQIESQAVDMLMDFSKGTIKQQSAYISKLKEYHSYSSAIEANPKLNKTQIKEIQYLYRSFLNCGKLDDIDLKKAKVVFDEIKKEELTACPIFFLGYLQSNGIGTQFNDCQENRDSLIESGGKEL